MSESRHDFSFLAVSKMRALKWAGVPAVEMMIPRLLRIFGEPAHKASKKSLWRGVSGQLASSSRPADRAATREHRHCRLPGCAALRRALLIPCAGRP